MGPGEAGGRGVDWPRSVRSRRAWRAGAAGRHPRPGRVAERPARGRGAAPAGAVAPTATGFRREGRCAASAPGRFRESRARAMAPRSHPPLAGQDDRFRQMGISQKDKVSPMSRSLPSDRTPLGVAVPFARLARRRGADRYRRRAAASRIEVPMVPVPMTMQTLAVTLVGALYGWRLGRSPWASGCWKARSACRSSPAAPAVSPSSSARPAAIWSASSSARGHRLAGRARLGRRSPGPRLRGDAGRQRALPCHRRHLACGADRHGPVIAAGVTPFLLGGVP